ncbi:MAG: response regulator transcription factor [Acidobacteria bacterium]|nr:response regulator transcription factor [Acidobacteriota bacterium]
MNRSNRIRVLIGDRQPIFRTGLNQLLSNQPGISVVGEAADGEETLKLTDERKPSILLLDSILVESPGTDILQQLQQKHKSVKVILLTPSEREGSGSLGNMAAGILPKQAAFDTLLECIHKVDAGEPWTNAQSDTPAAMPFGGSINSSSTSRENTPLSFREKQVVSLVSQGFRNKEIAEKMFISEQTVKNHLHNIFDKLGVSDRLELALYAIHKNLQSLE